MILFRCPACGTVHRAESQYAGGMIPCRHCREQVPIPQESDPECALIYKAGESEEGVPLTREEIRLKMVAGELGETDLIWEGSTWRPLGEVIGGIREGEGLRLRKPDDESEAETTEDELAESLEELSPIQKVDRENAGKKRRSKKKKKKKKKRGFRKKDSVAGTSAASAGGGDRPGAAGATKAGKAAKAKRPRGKGYYAAQIAMAVFAVVLGYKYGFGPLISNFRNLPSYVLVHNHEDSRYNARLGWRAKFGLGGYREDVFSHSMGSFELYVGMPESRALSLVPESEGSGEAFALKVPVRPGGITLVNLKGKGVYGVYDMSTVRGKKLDNPELKKLGAEIAANSAPATAIRVSRHIRDLVANAFLGTKTDPVFSDKQYRFADSLLLQIREKLQKARQKRGDEDAVEEARDKPVLHFPPSAPVSFANGSGVYRVSDDVPIDREVILPVSAFNLNRNRVLKANSPTLHITGNGQAIRLDIELADAQVKAENKTFKGTWHYQATCPLEGPRRNQWTWHWDFKGSAKAHGRTFNLSLRVNETGKQVKTVN